MRSRVRLGVGIVAVMLVAALWSCEGGGSSSPGSGPIPLDPDRYEVNNTPTSCASIGLTPGPGGNSASWGETDLTLHDEFDDDYYCFDLQLDSVLIITEVSDFASGDVDIQLLDAFGVVPLRTSSTQQDVEVITYSAPADRYMLRVFSPNQDTNTYSLAIVAQFATAPPGVPDLFEPNDDPNDPALCTTSPSNIGDLIAASPFIAANLSIHDTADVDYYCFYLSQVATVDIEILFRHLLGNLDLELLDSSQNLLLSSKTVTDNEELRRIVLPAEQFFVRVYGVPDPVTGTPDINTYVLQMTATPGGGLPLDGYEPNDDPVAVCQAPPGLGNPNFGNLSGLTTTATVPTVGPLSLTLHDIFDDDYFCFSLSQPGVAIIDAEFSHAAGNIDMQLLDSAQQVLFFAISFTDNERITTNILPPGEYTIRCYGRAVVNTYNLSVTVIEVDPIDRTTPNDDFASAWSIGSTDLLLNLTIHDVGDEDWFTFSLPPRGTDWAVSLDVFFQHWFGDLDMDLYDSAQNLIQFVQSRDDNEQISTTLPAGDYYVRVYGFGGALNYYDLRILSQ